ncbi:hypothetical protein VPHD292_0065 [Vibrio phage D292]
MRYQCTEWLEGFTVGAVYYTATTNPKFLNDEGHMISLSFSSLVQFFEEI